MGDLKQQDPNLSVEVDEMILDYLVYTTIQSVTNSRRSRGDSEVGQTDNLLNIFDTFLCLFKFKYPKRRPPQELRFNLRLLEFLVLFTQKGRVSNSAGNAFAKPHGTYKRTREIRPDTIMGDIKQDRAGHEGNGSEQVMAVLTETQNASLLDTLPRFLIISAVISNAMNEDPSQQWMELAAEYMLQAAIEQYTKYGAAGPEALEKCFRWGWVRSLDTKDDDLALINDMFRGSDEAEIVGWTETKEKYLRTFDYGGQSYFASSYRDLEGELPRTAFEMRVLEYADGLLGFLKKPILLQLELGQLDTLGLSEAQTEAFKWRVRII